MWGYALHWFEASLSLSAYLHGSDCDWPKASNDGMLQLRVSNSGSAAPASNVPLTATPLFALLAASLQHDSAAPTLELFPVKVTIRCMRQAPNPHGNIAAFAAALPAPGLPPASAHAAADGRAPEPAHADPFTLSGVHCWSPGLSHGAAPPHAHPCVCVSE